ncbi:MAG: helix-hairpin-helix domain-containing protein [Bacteroidaceae bacterium]|nr:helix-hairpin-helix domain-containing protein [Bacteroidaceae bacterium]
MRRLPFLSNSARRGLLLLEWIVILAVIGAFVYSWQKPKEDDSRKEDFPVSSVTKKQTAASRSDNYAVAEEKVETFPFDPNTADSTTLLRLGLAPWQVRAIYRYRAKHGRYHTPEEFKRLPGMTYELWERLGPQVRIARQFQYIDESEKRPSFPKTTTSASLPSEKPAVTEQTDSVKEPSRKFRTVTLVDINKADTTELMRIPGIGSYRSNRIVEYRRKLGGYLNVDQVMEACELPDEILQWVMVSAETPVRKLNVNQLSLQRLMSHPYITFYQARAIVEYRKAHGNIKGVEDLKGLEGFTPQKIEKLQPYLEY